MGREHAREAGSLTLPTAKKPFSQLLPIAQLVLYRLAGYAISGIPPETPRQERNERLLEIKRDLESAGMSSQDFEPIREFAREHFKINR